VTRRYRSIGLALIAAGLAFGISAATLGGGHPAPTAYHTTRTVPALVYVWGQPAGQLTTSGTVPVLVTNWGPTSEARP
jgi:hypothetical protein